jgi:hypothetical protein
LSNLTNDVVMRTALFVSSKSATITSNVLSSTRTGWTTMVSVSLLALTTYMLSYSTESMSMPVSITLWKIVRRAPVPSMTML